MRFSFLLLMILIVASCAKDHWFDPPEKLPDNCKPSNLISPKIKIAVVPDIHYMHPSLLPKDISDSPSFLDYLGKDRKLLELSDPIFRKVISELIAEKPDILLIPGDLVKDGELVSHVAVRGFLHILEKMHIKVFVVPGNNDILNPDALTFKTEPPTPVPNITPDAFARIYRDFGYSEARYRDTNSLSYICQPYSNLWILGIDNCKYTEKDGKIKVSGAINTDTKDWIEEKMAEARKKNITVLAMMHYGIIEHYAGQKNVEPLISGSKDNAIALMNAGIRLIFTGHYHACDIVEFTNNGQTLFDIQTGSLVTPPSSYRIINLDNNSVSIDTKRVTSIYARLPGGMNFLTYSEININKRLNSFFLYYLTKLFGLPEAAAVNLAPYFTNAFKAYFAGDEHISDEELEKLNALPSDFSPLVNLVKSVWTDLAPQDNKIDIELK